jgi:hypothetical protein
MAGYELRTVTHYGVEPVNGWPTKVYGMAVEGEPNGKLLDAARRLAAEVLPAGDGSRAAFVIAHRARPACFVLVYWWATAVDLSLAYFRSPLDQPADLEPLPADSVGCVWELGITNHEREAWVRHVLGASDLAAYLESTSPTKV